MTSTHSNKVIDCLKDEGILKDVSLKDKSSSQAPDDQHLVPEPNIDNENSPKKPIKKRKKKNNYKNLINSIVSVEKTDAQIKEEYREKMVNVLGGGAFSKLDKI